MAKPFKFRFVNEIVGTFVFLVVGLLVAGVLLVGQARQWFQPDILVRTVFPAEGTFGVKKGTEIRILDAPVGLVKRITVNADGAMEGVMTVQSDYARFVRKDSVAVVKKTFGVAGDAYINITVGTKEPFTDDQRVIPIQKDTELLEIVQLVVEQIQNAIVPALEEVQKTLAEYRGLAADLRDPKGNLQLAIANLNTTIQGVNQAIAGLNKGEGTAGKVLRDPALHDETAKILAQVNELMTQVRGSVTQADAILKDLKQTSAALPPVADTVRGEMRDVPGLVAKTQAALNEAERTLDGVQHHWLLRGYMTPEHPLDTLPLDAVGAGKE